MRIAGPTHLFTPLRDEHGRIVGRRPGIRGWLRHRCPELLPHYKAAMACKALADKR